VLQAALDAEMTEHLGYGKGDRSKPRSGNHRNGKSPKTVRTEVGPVDLAVPHDRNGSFEPKIVPKHARRLTGRGDHQSLHEGLTTGEIAAHLGEIYGTTVSRELISKITEPRGRTRRARPLGRRRR
jgi:putative transposase